MFNSKIVENKIFHTAQCLPNFNLLKYGNKKMTISAKFKLILVLEYNKIVQILKKKKIIIISNHFQISEIF